MHHPLRSLGLLLTLSPILLSGCSEPVTRGEKLSGRVTIDGVPVTAGNVLLVSEDGRLTAGGPLRGDGSYVIKEPPLGRVQIAVQTLMYRDRAAPPKEDGAPIEGRRTEIGSAGMVLPDPKERGLVYQAIPERYEEVETAGLTVVVTPGEQQFDIVLTGK